MKFGQFIKLEESAKKNPYSELSSRLRKEKNDMHSNAYRLVQQAIKAMNVGEDHDEALKKYMPKGAGRSNIAKKIYKQYVGFWERNADLIGMKESDIRAIVGY